MAKTSYIDLPLGLEEQFLAGVRTGDRFRFAKLVRKTTLYSVKKKKALSARSILPSISVLWSGLSPAEKTAWTNAGVQCGLSGWRLFVKDTSARIENDLSGVAIPSLLHQDWVGKLKIEAPASELKIVQIHPRSYWVYRKVAGKKGMYEPVLITEDLALDFKISLNYRAELVADGPTPSAKFYARFWHSYQGADRYSDFVITLDLDTTAEPDDGWKKAEATISLFGVGPFGDTIFAAESELLGYYIRYDLYFHLKDLTGNLFIDNVKVVHSSQNWVRDTYCDDINKSFTHAFYQIPKRWAVVTLPSGASYESIYKDF